MGLIIIIIIIIIIIMRKFSHIRTWKLWKYLQIQVEKYWYLAENQAGNNFFLVYLIGRLARKLCLVMADASLQAALAETKAEVLRLSVGTNGVTWLITLGGGDKIVQGY